MTLLLIMEAVEKDRLDPEGNLTAGDDVASVGGSHIWIKPGESLPFNDLLKAFAIVSANDAGKVFADAISGSEGAFVADMNARAKDLGMEDTVYKNCNGIEEEGHVTTAKDIATVTKEVLKYPQVLDYTSIWMDTIRDGKTQIVNTNRLLKTYDGAIGLKTGTTTEGGSCISAVACRDGLTLISVVLGSEYGADRFSDATKLLDFGFANFEAIEPELSSEKLQPIKVNSGVFPSVDVTMKKVGEILIPKGKEKNIKTEVSVLPEVEAPVKAGQRVGNVAYKIDNEVLLECPVEASKTIKKLNFSSAFGILFRSFLTM